MVIGEEIVKISAGGAFDVLLADDAPV